MTIFWDMDGSIADLYAVPNWLDYLLKEDVFPYVQAAPMVDMTALRERLTRLREIGVKIAVASWTSKCGSPDYNRAVRRAKVQWLKDCGIHDCIDEIHVVKYGTRKSKFAKFGDIIIDDELNNRVDWIAHGGMAIDPTSVDIIETLDMFIRTLSQG